MNPLELQVLSIVCGVPETAQNAPATDSRVPRQAPVVAIPPQHLPAPRKTPPPASR